MNRPRFLIVGADSWLTTVLFESLCQHSEICLLHHPEASLDGLEPSEWGGLFGEVANEAVCGVAMSGRLFSKEAPARIRELLPQGKVVLMLRPPVTAMRSWHHERLRDAREDQVDFGQALEKEREQSEGKRGTRAMGYRAAARFSERVEDYFEAFGRENVFVRLEEDLEKDSERCFRELLEFLGVDSSVQITVVSESDSDVLCGTHHFDLSVGRLVNRLPGGGGLKKLFASSLEARYRKLADRIFAPMSDQSINSILEEELLEEFEPEVAKLGRLLERDLSHWNEPRFPRGEEDHHHH